MPRESATSGFHANEVVDGLLLAASAPGVTSARIERRSDRYRISMHRGADTQVIGYAPGALGEAVRARLALLAGIRCRHERETLGRCRVRLGNGPAEMLFSLSDDVCEVRRLSGAVGPPLFMLAPSEVNDRVGSYVLESVIGRGGMGIVYRAVHEWLGTEVAIKVLHRGARPSLDATRAALFVREAWAASRVQHPGVVRILDAGMAEGRAYLVMELIEAPTLRDVLRRRSLAPEAVARMGAALCMAVDAIHEVGVVHCDLKPENVFLRDDEVKITDFGAAWMLDTTGAESGWPLFATPEYLAPEVAAGSAPLRASDVYAIGRLLFEALTGDVPASRSMEVEDLRAVAGAGLGGVLARALAERPGERFATAAEMGRALLAVADPRATAGPERMEAP